MLGAAFTVAALVLILTVLIGGPGFTEEQSQVDPADVQLYVPGPDVNEQMLLGEAENIIYEVNEDGKRILFYANRIVPRNEGEIDAIDTTIQIQLAAGRELTIEADEGTIVAPDQHPQEGEMRGNVIVTLYESPDGSPVDTSSDRDVAIRMYFDDPVEFDLELQQIDSIGPIFLTGPQVQFHGRGLSMNYNQLRQRIERLVIEQGESLRYIPEPPAFTEDNDNDATRNVKPVHKSRPERLVPQNDKPSAADNSESVEAAADRDEPKQPIQYYHATFEQLDEVRVGLDQYIVQGDNLSAIFSTKTAEEIDAESEQQGGEPAASRRVNNRRADTSLASASSDTLNAALAYALAVSIGQFPDVDPRSLATFTDDDVVIRWSGRLTVLPLTKDNLPEEVAGTDDVLVTVTGNPVKILTDKQESFKAPKVSFLSKRSIMQAVGTSDSPVILEATDLGSLSVLKLDVDQAQGTGKAVGPGTLTGLIRDEDDKTKTKPLSISFMDQLDLAFYLEQDGTSSSGNKEPVKDSSIKGVKSADFIGEVQVKYDELDMSTDRLTLALREDVPEGDDKLAVELLTATGSINAYVKKEDIRIKAEKLLAFPAKDQLELFGTDDKLATVIHPDATLAAEHMVMDDRAGTVDVPGPGSFTFQPDPDDPGKTVYVTWTKQMRYDDMAGVARFVGDVKTKAIDGTDTNELMGNELVLTFVEDTSVDTTNADPNDPTTGRRLAEAVMDGNVRYRARSYATNQLKQEQLLTELYMTDADKMIFTDPGEVSDSASGQVAKKVDILGAGRMLITDKRPKDESDTSAGNANAIAMSGSGLTAFQWTDSLLLDLTQGEMLMKGNVAMVHQPESGDRVELYCHDLAAELRPADDSVSSKKKQGGWLSEDAPQPELDRVWADGGIVIRTADISVTCDHMLYQETKGEIILWSDEPGFVEYRAKGEPTPARSSAFKWYRDTGRVEALKLRTGMIPLRRSEQ